VRAVVSKKEKRKLNDAAGLDLMGAP